MHTNDMLYNHLWTKSKIYVIPTTLVVVTDRATQTEYDLLYKEALSIVNNFETIERYWQRIETTNQLLRMTTLGLGISFFLLIRDPLYIYI